MTTQLDRIEAMLIHLDLYCRTELALRPGALNTEVPFELNKGCIVVAERLDSGEKRNMTDKVVEAVARAILEARDIVMRGLPDKALWLAYPKDRALKEAQAAIDTYLKILEKEGKRVISEHDLQELITNRQVYEG